MTMVPVTPVAENGLTNTTTFNSGSRIAMATRR